MKRQILAWLLVCMILAACGTANDAAGNTALPQSTVPAAANMEMRDSAPMMGAEMEDAGTAPVDERAGETAVYSDDAQRAIALLAAREDVAAHLAVYPDWSGEAWPEEDGVWGVDLYSEAADEWLGWGMVNLDTGAVIEYFVPRELSAEEFQAGLGEVEAFVFADAEVLALLGDPAQWEHETYYNRWDAAWETWFWHGLEEFGVIVHRDEEGMWLDRIVDPNEFEAEEQAELMRNQAVELAYEAPGVDEALAGVDDWHTYISEQGNGQWLVEFASGEGLHFYALVDVEAWKIIESGE